MHKDVETTLGRLATDPTLRRSFVADPEAALARLVTQGLDLNEVELEALAATNPETLNTFAESLDRRLKKAPSAVEPNPATQTRQPQPNKETQTMNTTRTRSTLSALVIALAAPFFGPSSAAQASDWTWKVTPYAWATDIGVDIVVDDRQLLDTEIAFEDLLEDVETVAQVRVEAQRGAHGLLFDIFDVTMADEGSITLPDGSGTAELASDIGMTLFEAAGVYDPKGDGKGLSLLYGTRLLSQRFESDARVERNTGTGTTTKTSSFEAEDTLIDALVGVRYTFRLSPRWSTQTRLDASTGGTEFSWSAGSEIAYSFGRDVNGRGGRYALTAGYRRLTVDFDTEESTDIDMTLSGFVLGFRASF